MRNRALPPHRRQFSLFFAVLILALTSRLPAEPVQAKHREGSTHSFLLLKSEGGKVIAVGDQTVLVRGVEVRSRLVFRFKDGSIDEETTVMRQGSTFQLVNDHHIQKGASFPQPLDISVNVPLSQVTWKETKDGRGEFKTEHVDLPADLANGMMSLVIENYPLNSSELKVSYLTLDSKPRLVTLQIKPDGQDKFEVGGSQREANRFNVHIEIGGAAGVIAPVVGKQPSDIKLWVMDGEVPTFLKMEGALYQKGPTWIMVPGAPVWASGSGNQGSR